MPVFGSGVADFIDGPVVVVIINPIPSLGAQNKGSQPRVGVDRGRLLTNDPVSLALEQSGAHVAIEKAIGDIALLIDVEYRRPGAFVNTMLAWIKEGDTYTVYFSLNQPVPASGVPTLGLNVRERTLPSVYEYLGWS